MINTHLFVTRAPVSHESLDHHHHLHLPGHHHHTERDESTPQSARQDRHDRSILTPLSTTTSSASAPSTTSSTDEKPTTSHHSSPTLSIPSLLEQELQATTKAALATAGNRSSVIVETSAVPTAGAAEKEESMHKIASGRPDTAQLIRDAVMTAKAGERVLVAACGPDSLLTVVRDTTAKLIRGEGPGVELHCESFGW